MLLPQRHIQRSQRSHRDQRHLPHDTHVDDRGVARLLAEDSQFVGKLTGRIKVRSQYPRCINQRLFIVLVPLLFLQVWKTVPWFPEGNVSRVFARIFSINSEEQTSENRGPFVTYLRMNYR